MVLDQDPQAQKQTDPADSDPQRWNKQVMMIDDTILLI
jgi:hypothetical protein